MGIFRRLTRIVATDNHSPATRGGCACQEHIESLLDEVVPYAPAQELDFDEMTVGDLLDDGALGVSPAHQVWADLSYDDGTSTRVGPFHWTLWVGDEARTMYDDDAAVQVDQALLAQPGVDLVEWRDREIFEVSAPTLCADGMLAAAAKALMDPRIKG